MTKRLLLILVTALGVIFLLYSCGRGVKDTAPFILSFSPANGKSGITITARISATFNEPITIDTSAFTLVSSSGAPVAGTVTYDSSSHTATFIPSLNLDYDTTYVATISTSVKDLAGNPLSSAATWSFSTTTSNFSNVDLRAISFPSGATTGYIVGTGGNILKTTDGGITWTPLTSETNQDLYDVVFTGPTNSYAVGAEGTILKTTDGGTTWTAQTSGTIQNLYDVSHWADITILCAVGAGGTILKSTDSGATWTTQTRGTTQDLYYFQYQGWAAAWVIGAGGVFLKTSNTGESWSLQDIGTTKDLYAISAAGAGGGGDSVRYIVGANGLILMSPEPDGSVWNTQTSEATQDLYSIWAVNINTAYAAGAGGKILKTTNKGTNWDPQTSRTTQNLYNFYFFDADTGWSVGAGGTILKTTNGGTNWN